MRLSKAEQKRKERKAWKERGFIWLGVWIKPEWKSRILEFVKQLGDAVIVIDKFHIAKMANEAVEKGRKSLRESMTAELALALKNDRFVMLRREERLSCWTEHYLQLKELHRLKEGFFTIFDSRMPRSQAEAAYAAWEQSIPENLAHFFKPLTTAVNGWHQEVFNYFDEN